MIEGNILVQARTHLRFLNTSPGTYLFTLPFNSPSLWQRIIQAKYPGACNILAQYLKGQTYFQGWRQIFSR
jgi:hypothetical protein